MRDEIKFARCFLDYCNTNDESNKQNQLNEFVEWIKKLPEPQRMLLTDRLFRMIDSVVLDYVNNVVGKVDVDKKNSFSEEAVIDMLRLAIRTVEYLDDASYDRTKRYAVYLNKKNADFKSATLKALSEEWLGITEKMMSPDDKLFFELYELNRIAKQANETRLKEGKHPFEFRISPVRGVSSSYSAFVEFEDDNVKLELVKPNRRGETTILVPLELFSEEDQKKFRSY